MEPRIRFKGFNGDWKKRVLGSLGSVAMCKRIYKDQTSETGDVPFYKIGTFGSEADAFISRELYEEYKQKFNYPEKGDILISAAGTIGRTVEYLGENAYFQDSNIVWLKHNDEIKNSFLKHLYSVITWKGLEGATIKRLYNSIILETEIQLPSKEEQQTIAIYLDNLDSLIQSTAKKIGSLKQVKAASLQSMFPQVGDTTPHVRFKGFEGEWNKMKLKDICYKDTSSLSENSLGMNRGNYAVYGASGYLQNIDSYKFDCPYVGIIKDGSGVGKSKLYPAFSSLIGTMQYILPKSNTHIGYLAYLIETLDLSSYVNGSSIPHIYFKDYSEEFVSVPSQMKEGELIGNYFFSLDNQISLQEKRLEKLKRIKATCLDKMFV